MVELRRSNTLTVDELVMERLRKTKSEKLKEATKYQHVELADVERRLKSFENLD